MLEHSYSILSVLITFSRKKNLFTLMKVNKQTSGLQREV